MHYFVDSVIVDNPLGVVMDNELFGLIMDRHDSNESFIFSATPIFVLASLAHHWVWRVSVKVWADLTKDTWAGSCR